MLAFQLILTGRVQGVGFRWWTRARARELELMGSVTNQLDGAVSIFAQGDPEKVRTLLRYATEEPSTYARPGWVEDYELHWTQPIPHLCGFSAL